MKPIRLTALLAFLLISVAGFADDEKKIPLADVPRKVLDAVKEKFPRADLKEAVKVVDDDETTFEISLISGVKHITVSLEDDGEIEEIETEIATAELPRTVTEAIAVKYPKATLKEAEEVIEFEDGKEKTEKIYDVVFTTAEGKEVEARVDASGKIEEEEDDD
jgi:hypothetical protein